MARRRRKPKTQKKDQPERQWWAPYFLLPDDPEHERLRKENAMLRENPALANSLVVEARLRVRPGRR